jgi:putative Holliday junction resolvase
VRDLALDLGERRIGLAVGDDEAGIARAIPALRRRSHDADVAALRSVVREEEVDALLVGLPLTLSGAEGRQATWARAQAESLAAALALPLELRDERLTTWAAEQRRDGRRFDVDSEAAAIILQERLDEARRERRA